MNLTESFLALAAVAFILYLLVSIANDETDD